MLCDKHQRLWVTLPTISGGGGKTAALNSTSPYKHAWGKNSWSQFHTYSQTCLILVTDISMWFPIAADNTSGGTFKAWLCSVLGRKL